MAEHASRMACSTSDGIDDNAFALPAALVCILQLATKLVWTAGQMRLLSFSMNGPACAPSVET